MKSIKLRLIATIILLAINGKYSNAQNWLPLDKGLLGSLTNFFVDTNTNMLYVTGIFSANSDNIYGGVAKWDGKVWDTLPNCLEWPTKHIVFKYFDTLYISGYFYSNLPSTNIAKWNGSVFDTISGTSGMNIYCTVEKDGLLYLGGNFKQCGGLPAFSLCSYDGHEFTPLTPKYNESATILTMIFYKDTLYVGGNFGLNPQISVASLAKWDGMELLAVDNQFANVNCTIYDLAVYKNELYVGGAFRKSNGFTGDFIMKWDGHQFSEVGGGTNQRVTTMEVYNDELYVGGWFTEVGGVSCDNLAKWDGNQWTCLNHDAFDFTFSIRDLCILQDTLYIAGHFSKIGADSLQCIAKYNHQLTSVNENDNTTNKIDIYPNPATTALTISSPNEFIGINIYNTQGQVVQKIEMLENLKLIDISHLRNGLYFIRVINKNGISLTNKFIKQ